jgi:hypothetical protein
MGSLKRKLNKPLVKRLREEFFSYIIMPKDKDACWTWTHSMNERGYPYLCRKSHIMSARQLSWFYEYGDEAKVGLKSLCNNSQCVNPKHLSTTFPKGMLNKSKNPFHETKKRSNLPRIIKPTATMKPGIGYWGRLWRALRGKV